MATGAARGGAGAKQRARAMRIGDRIWGIDADYLSALSQLSGSTFSLHGYPDFAAQLAALQRGDVDMVLSTRQRDLPADVLTSESWFTSPMRIYRNRDNQRAVMFNSDNAQLTIAADTLAQLPQTFASPPLADAARQFTGAGMRC